MAKTRMINSSRFQKQATIMITNQLQAIAENTRVNVQLVIADKLEEVYKHNIDNSYQSRSAKGKAIDEYNKTHTRTRTRTYHHTYTLRDAVSSKIEGKYVKIKIDGRRKYKKYGENKSVSVTQVYEWLTKGTTATRTKLCTYN